MNPFIGKELAATEAGARSRPVIHIRRVGQTDHAAPPLTLWNPDGNHFVKEPTTDGSEIPSYGLPGVVERPW